MEPYFKSVSQLPIETSLRVYRRYLKFDMNHIEDFIESLLSAKRWQEVAERMAQCLNDPTIQSVKGRTRHELWLELCHILTTHAQDVSGLPVDAIIRGGIRKFTDQAGRLWTALAVVYIRKGFFEKARDVYEEGMMTVITVREFTLILDACTQFEESMVAARMETMDVCNELDGTDAAAGGLEHKADGEEEGHREVVGKEGMAGNGAHSVSPTANGAQTMSEKKGKAGLKDHFQKWERELLATFWLNDDNDVDLRLAWLENFDGA